MGFIMALKKRKGISYWEKKLIGSGGVLNEFVKYRDAIGFTPAGKPICICITCGKKVSGQNLHAGHFISRRYKKVAYDERNINAQCGVPCNDKRIGKGEPLKYRRKLIEIYGEEEVKELEDAQYSTGKHWTPSQLEEKFNYYSKKVKELE